MTEEETRTPKPIANAIRRLLRQHGLSERQMSERLGRGKTWLSDALRRHPLTFEGAEDIAGEFGITLPELIAEAYPDPANPAVSPYALLADLAPERETRPLPPELCDDLKALLTHTPNVRAVEPPKYEVLRGIQNHIWIDRRRVVHYALFHLSEASRPRYIHTFIGALAILSDVLRACRAVDLYHRTQCLLRAHELLQVYPHPGIAALVTEKTAYLCWDITSNPQITATLLEHTLTIPHPFQDHLFACRAQFHMIREQAENALSYADVVLNLETSAVTMASARTIIANVYANQGEPATGLSHLLEATKLSDLPEHLRINLHAEIARFQLMVGQVDQALDTFWSVIQNTSYCEVWPAKAGFVALDFLRADPPENFLKQATPRLLAIQSQLDPQQKVEAAVLRSMSPYLATATAASPTALQKKDVDPNG